MSFNRSRCKQFEFEYNSKKYNIPLLNSYLVDIDELNNVQHHVGKKKPVIMDVGQDQLTHKAYYLSQELEKYEVHTVFFAGDRFGLGAENVKNEKLTHIPMSHSSFDNWRKFRAMVKQYKPAHIELFLGIKSYDIIYYVLYAKLHHIPVVVRCRGGEIRKWTTHRFHRQLANQFALKNAQIVLLRELYMPLYLLQYHIAKLKHCFLFHNHVPIPPHHAARREPVILFLNSLNPLRRPLMMIDIAEILRARKCSFRFVVVGLTDKKMKSHQVSECEEEFCDELIKRNMSDLFELHMFTNDTRQYYEKASIFILPTDFVFCNHSLIESMSYGCVPLIDGGDGGEYIVEDGISGYILNGKTEEYADRIEKLLTDHKLLLDMGTQARNKVISEYNSNKQATVLLNLYESELWE